MKLAWLTDTTTSIENNIKQEDLFVVSLSTILDGKIYKDTDFESANEFFELLKKYGNGAKTAQPTPQAFEEIYKEIENAGYTHVIAIHPSDTLSGTINASKNTASNFKMETYVLDSGTGSFTQKEILSYGRELVQEGKDFNEIIESLKSVKQTGELYLLPRNLTQLKNSGRVSSGKYILSSVLNIKLLLKLEKGVIDLEMKSRGMKKVENYLIQQINQRISEGVKRIGVIHAGNEKEAHAWKTRIKALSDKIEVFIEPLVPVACVHTGHESIALAWINNSKK